jgi:hypothetical protein
MSQTANDNIPRLPKGILIEGIVTTLNADGSPHVSPMGPIVDDGFKRLLLRPYNTSTTFQNLKRAGQGILHVTDDVGLFARAAVGQLKQPPKMIPATAVEGQIIADACRWYAFKVDSIHDRQERTEIAATVVDRGRIRDFVGFNRAKHAVIEAAILATRLQFLDVHAVRTELRSLATIVDKTGGRQERAAFAFLQEYVKGHPHSAHPAGAANE